MGDHRGYIARLIIRAIEIPPFFISRLKTRLSVREARARGGLTFSRGIQIKALPSGGSPLLLIDEHSPLVYTACTYWNVSAAKFYISLL